MPRDISVAAQANADSEIPFYTEIFNVSLGDGSVLNLTPHPPATGSGTLSFTFGGIPYQSFSVGRGTTQQTSDQQVSSVAVEFQNVDLAFGALITNNQDQIRGQPVTISGVMLSSGTNTPISDNVEDLIPVLDGAIGPIKVDHDKVSMQLDRDIEDTTVDSPRRFYAGADGFVFLPPVG